MCVFMAEIAVFADQIGKDKFVLVALGALLEALRSLDVALGAFKLEMLKFQVKIGFRVIEFKPIFKTFSSMTVAAWHVCEF